MKIFQKTRQKRSKSGFTLMEVIVASLIFALAMAGIFASVTELRQPAVESTQEVTAAFLGKQILEGLRQQVNAETWNNPGAELAPNTTRNLTPITINGTTYTPRYQVLTDPNGTNARQVTLNITW